MQYALVSLKTSIIDQTTYKLALIHSNRLIPGIICLICKCVMSKQSCIKIKLGWLAILRIFILKVK